MPTVFWPDELVSRSRSSWMAEIHLYINLEGTVPGMFWNIGSKNFHWLTLLCEMSRKLIPEATLSPNNCFHLCLWRWKFCKFHTEVRRVWPCGNCLCKTVTVSSKNGDSSTGIVLRVFYISFTYFNVIFAIRSPKCPFHLLVIQSFDLILLGCKL